MNVKLIAATTPLIEGVTSIDELLAYAARVSNPSNQLNSGTAAKLLGYCIRHGHWSVFETASFTVEIETSLAIAMQILRHRSFTFQMFSQRYAEVDKLGDMLEVPILRMKSKEGNRQGSAEDAPEEIQLSQANTREYLTMNYRDLLAAGVAPESARFYLPQCTKTRLYMTGNIRSWIHYLAQRLDSHAQKEHRDIAREKIRDIFADLCPVTYEACISTAIPEHFVLPCIQS